MDLGKVKQLSQHVSQPTAERLRTMLTFIEDETVYSQLEERATTRKSHLEPGDEKLLAAHHHEPSTAVPQATLFYRVESKKQRRRLLNWPESLNKYLRHQYTSQVKDCLDACEIGDNRHVRVFDMEAGFYQVPIPHYLRRLMAAKIGRRCMQPTRLPMGLTIAPDLLEAILAVIVEAAITLSGTSNVTHWIHIDNVRFAAPNKSDVDTVAAKFQALCKDVDCQITEEDPTVFLGVHYNYTTAEVSLTTDFGEKLRQSAADVLTHQETTLGEVRELIGRCVYASRVLRTCLAGHYHVMKFVRRKTADLTENDAMTTVWPSVVPEWKEWVDTLTADGATAIHPPRQQAAQFVMYTDASTAGFGALLVNAETGEILEHGRKWDKRHEAKEINQLEANAVFQAAEFFSSHLTRARSIHLVVDNTSVRATLARGSAAAHLLNGEIRKALRTLPSTADIRVSYVESAGNPADAPSRGQSADRNLVRSACGKMAEDWPAKSALRLRAFGGTRRLVCPSAKTNCDRTGST